MTSESSDRFSEASSRGNRTVIVHYHLFKNAGSSVDHILKQNFKGNLWRNEEFKGPTTNIPLVLSGQSNSQQVQDWLAKHPEVAVLSSHTAAMPPPRLPDTRVFPIVMVRNPMVRLQSSYLFERKQFASGQHTITTKLAGSTDLAGYLQGLLEMKTQSMARNFAAVRLAGAVPGSPDQLRERTIEALELLPFVGVVELFDRSMLVLERRLKPLFPSFQALPAWLNASEEVCTALPDRLDRIRREIGDDLYQHTLSANRIEVELHEAASEQIMAASQGRVA